MLLIGYLLLYGYEMDSHLYGFASDFVCWIFQFLVIVVVLDSLSCLLV